MNESLMIIVEKIVRPIRVPLIKKMRMRGELYSHLEAIYNEELTHHENHEQALEATLNRFGDLDEIRGELQSTVPKWWQRLTWLDSFFQRRSGETPLRHAIRSALYAMLFISAEYLLVMLPLGQILMDKQEQFIMMGPFFACLALSSGWLAFMAVICASPFSVNWTESLNVSLLIRNTTFFGLASALAEFSLFASIPSLIGFEQAQLIMPGAAFFAGAGLFLVVILAMRKELGQSRPWTNLELTD